MSSKRPRTENGDGNQSESRTVAQATYDILASHGMSIMFGNPGSNELPFLTAMPEGFDYVLGLHEGAVVGMADGYAQATGRPVLVSLHAASGSGNAMGALTNAHYSHSPLVLLAGQQIRRMVGQEVMLSSVDAALLPRPLVKWSHEPLAPQDVPRSVAQAIFEAGTQPRGPVYLSVPLDDWNEPALPDDKHLTRRGISTAGTLSTEQLAELTEHIDSFNKPALIVGPDTDVDAAQEHVQRLAEKLGAAVWIAPSSWRCSFPTDHPLFRGVLPPGIESVRSRLEGHDGVIVIGAPVLRYHRWEPAAYLPPGVDVIHITCDVGEATRAPYGYSYVAPVGSTARALAESVKDRSLPLPPPRVIPAAAKSTSGMTGEEVLEVLDNTPGHKPIFVNEATTLDLLFMERVRISDSGRYHFPASGGLGFGLPVAVGISLAKPTETIVAVVGDGSANYGITALWTAAQRRTRTVFVIVNNGSYGALRRFATALNATNAPGLDVPGIDFVHLAKGYGVPATRTTTREEFDKEYKAALAAEGPVLIDARVVL